MKICNCYQDINKVLCDIPSEWRSGIVKALCFTINSFPSIECEMINNCETVTSLSEFNIKKNILSVSYKDEKGRNNIRTVNLENVINNISNDINPNCLPLSNSLVEFIQNYIDKFCTCCTTTTTTTTSTTTTTTTSSTTTTTTNPFRYFLTDVYTCIQGSCIQVDNNVTIRVPSNFSPIIGGYYQGVIPDDDLLYHILAEISAPIGVPQDINTANNFTQCTNFCPTTTTTTSTTTTTTCCPITNADIILSTTTTTTTP